MDREQIIRMAREAGFDPHDMSDDFTCNLMDIKRFAALVAAAEREKREWVGLTDEEMEALFLNQDDVRFARYIESRLKDKNA